MKTKQGLDLESPGLFSECPLTKTELAKLLNVSRTTVVSWDRIAYYRIPSYRETYPRKVSGEYDRECPLMPYQIWVLSLVGRTMQMLKSADRVRNYINKNPQDFSKYKFQFQATQVFGGKSAA